MNSKKTERMLKKLEKIRLKNHMSYEKMSREIGVTTRTVTRWLKREHYPSEIALGLIYIFIVKWDKP